MQNLPPGMKRFLLPDPNYILYNIDLSQAENRVVAYIAPEPTMIEAFESGADIHKLTASLIFNKPVDQISDEDGSCSIGGGVYSERFWGKKANHGLNYDLGYKTFSYYYEIPENEGKYIVDMYHKSYPGIRQMHLWIQRMLQTNRTLVNLFGRKRTYLGRWDDELFKEAYSFIPQSTVADKINRHGIMHIWDHPGIYGPAEILNQVHDSIVLQIPVTVSWQGHAKILLDLVQSLEQPLTWKSLQFSIPADVSIGLNLKNMEKVDLKNEDPANVLREAYRKLLDTREEKLNLAEEYEDTEDDEQEVDDIISVIGA